MQDQYIKNNDVSTMKCKKSKKFIDSGLWELYVGGPIT